jgi:hypothetical protein
LDALYVRPKGELQGWSESKVQKRNIFMKYEISLSHVLKTGPFGPLSYIHHYANSRKKNIHVKRGRIVYVRSQ